MDIKRIIEDLGGGTKVAAECEVTKSAVSQWVTNNHIPKGFHKFLKERYPEAFGERRTRNRRSNGDRRKVS